MSLPAIGQDPWGTDLNTYLAGLEARIADLEDNRTFPPLLYNYSNSTSAPPASQQVRTDSSFASQATTRFYFSKTSLTGRQVTLIGDVDTTFSLYVEDADNATTRQWFKVVALPIDHGTWWEVLVTWFAGVASAPNNNRAVTVVFTNQV